MLKLKSNRDGSFTLQGDGSENLVLCSVSISFPEVTSPAAGQHQHHIAGPAEVSIVVRSPNGSQETHSDIQMEW